MKQPAAATQLSFDATLENWADGMDYCAVAVPAAITAALGTKSAVLVWARLNDSAPFQVSLFPVGGGRHYIRIKAAVRKATNTKEGDTVHLNITVRDRSDIAYPDDLLAALGDDGTAAFASLPPGRQNFMIRRIDEAVRPKTRAKRILDVVDETRRLAAQRGKRRG